MKTCTECGLSKGLSEFSYQNGKPRAACKPCRSARQRARNALPGAKQARRDYQLKKKYGLSTHEWEAILEAQGFRCPICGVHASEHPNVFHVDHNHATGEVRGLLCEDCNPALGGFKDSVEVLTSAIEYLKARGSYG